MFYYVLVSYLISATNEDVNVMTANELHFLKSVYFTMYFSYFTHMHLYLTFSDSTDSKMTVM